MVMAWFCLPIHKVQWAGDTAIDSVAKPKYCHLALILKLVRLKCPSSTQFIQQANIAQGHQQVNNLAEENITPQNELLKDGYAKLDSGGATTAKRIDTTLEALEKIHRRQNTGRQKKVRAECLQNRQKS